MSHIQLSARLLLLIISGNLKKMFYMFYAQSCVTHLVRNLLTCVYHFYVKIKYFFSLFETIYIVLSISL